MIGPTTTSTGPVSCRRRRPRGRSRGPRNSHCRWTDCRGPLTINEIDPLGLWGWNPISDVTQAWNDTGGKAVHFVAKHKAAVTEIAAGVGVVAVVTVATVATGGIADAVALGAAGASEEVGGAIAGESAAGLLGVTFPLDATIAVAPVGLVGLGGLGLIGYGSYELYSQLTASHGGHGYPGPNCR